MHSLTSLVDLNYSQIRNLGTSLLLYTFALKGSLLRGYNYSYRLISSKPTFDFWCLILWRESANCIQWICRNVKYTGGVYTSVSLFLTFFIFFLLLLLAPHAPENFSIGALRRTGIIEKPIPEFRVDKKFSVWVLVYSILVKECRESPWLKSSMEKSF